MKVDIKNIKKIIGEEIARELKTNKKLAEMGMQSRLHAMNMPSQNLTGADSAVDALSDAFSEVRDETISSFGGDSSTLHGLGVDVGWRPEGDDFLAVAKKFHSAMGRMPTMAEWKATGFGMPSDPRLIGR